MPSSDNPIKINASGLLLVEGVDDDAFFGELLKRLHLQDKIQIIQYEGKEKLYAFLNTLPLLPDFKQVTTIGISRDADDDRNHTFESVRNGLRRAGLSVPRQVMQLVPGKPQIAIMILPGSMPGRMLEDICVEALNDEITRKCVEPYFQCLESQQILISENRIAKAKLQLMLGLKNDGEVRLRYAVVRDWWDWTHPTFEEVKQFVRLVAGE